MVCENIPVPSAVTGTSYSDNLQTNLHELRLTFLWPILPNGQLPSRPARQTFRTLVAGQIVSTNNLYYFFQSQSFINVP
jgi:hypothetical protein